MKPMKKEKKAKWYAVKNGRDTGVFNTCECFPFVLI